VGGSSLNVGWVRTASRRESAVANEDNGAVTPTDNLACPALGRQAAAGRAARPRVSRVGSSRMSKPREVMLDRFGWDATPLNSSLLVNASQAARSCHVYTPPNVLLAGSASQILEISPGNAANCGANSRQSFSNSTGVVLFKLKFTIWMYMVPPPIASEYSLRRAMASIRSKELKTGHIVIQPGGLLLITMAQSSRPQGNA